jgi:hypothetical protein
VPLLMQEERGRLAEVSQAGKSFFHGRMHTPREAHLVMLAVRKGLASPIATRCKPQLFRTTQDGYVAF